jgi:DNA-binding NtrC family response regulator
MQSGNPFDVVVMDLTVPGGMGGKETVGKIREIDPKAKVIVSSGYSNDPVMANYKDFGFCGIIAKPFNIDEFLNVIKKAVSDSQDKEKQGS